MALNTDYAIRTGAFDPVQLSKHENVSDTEHLSHNELKQKAEKRYQEAKVVLLLLLLLLLLMLFLLLLMLLLLLLCQFNSLLTNLCREQKLRNWFLAQMTLLCVFGNLQPVRNVWQG